MKKEEEGETDIVGDSQTNDAVPDDSISKEPDGEVVLGRMDSSGAPEIVPEMQQLHQSDGLSGTSSTENVPEIQQLHQSDGLSGTSSTENVSGKLKIQKVPAIFREVESSNNCYDPMIVAIGPYHHGNNKLKRIEAFKIQFREQYGCECGKPWEEIYKEMKTSLVEAKNYYIGDVEENFKDKDEKFAEMMFLDSCFVIQFIDNCVDPKEDGAKITNFDSPFIMRDIMLLENQLPFDILKKLMSFKGQHKGEEIVDKFIAMIINDHRTEKEKGTNKAKEKPVRHLLELVQTRLVDDQEISGRIEKYESAQKEAERWKTCFRLHLPSSNKEIKNEDVKIGIVDDRGRVEEHEGTKKEEQRWKTFFGFHLPSSNKKIKNELSIKSSPMGWKYRSVQELKSMGIHFRPSDTCQFSDITFTSRHLYGWLNLPRIRIQKGTKSLLLNLVAFEACADLSSNFGVSSYVAFMDTLIDHAEDVKELRSKGIIHNLLSNDEQVAKLFNEMGESVEVVDRRIWASVQDSLDDFYNSHRSLWFTECLNNHCRSPWAVIGIVAAIVVVFLTISQTVFSAIQL